MSITDICSDQISLISGGNSYIREKENHIVRYILESSALRDDIVKDGMFMRCINVVRKKYGITLCLPKRKPLECTYHFWGILHDLEEEIPQC